MDESASQWKFWQFLDSAFPTGGFAHSGGLEAARQHGEISGRAGLEGWILTSLRQLAHASLPWVCTAHREPHRIHELDDLAQTAPLLDLWQGTQDRLYSRLFQT